MFKEMDKVLTGYLSGGEGGLPEWRGGPDRLQNVHLRAGTAMEVDVIVWQLIVASFCSLLL